LRLARTEADLRNAVEDLRPQGAVGFVPTMGALHEGHLSLVRAAATGCPSVVVSIFVNPLQFGPNEDLAFYPRDEEADLKLLESQNVDVVFLPTVETMYPEGRTTSVSVGPLSLVVEGLSRPGHFDGVATVVAKLFNLVQPSVAFFGQKDAQQLAVIRRMVADLSLPIEIVGCPTVREADGLALSSRNMFLDDEARRAAASLWSALEAGRDAWTADKDRDSVEKVMWEVLIAGGVDPDYAHVVDPDTFETPSRGGGVLLVVAAKAGDTRLIDNLLLQQGDG
jgi:pantoate--beta-alanine ligase